MFRLTVVLILLLLVTSGIGWISQTTVIMRALPQSVSRDKPRKRALLVGVSEYCRDKTEAECRRGRKFWWDLHTANDVDALQQILTTEQFGFKSEDVKVLKTRDETTHENIIKTFQSFLIEQTTAGDIVYFHFSGHGNPVEDDKKHGRNQKIGDELDGADESLVPSDYVTQDDGSNNIRDDDIEQLLAQLSGRHVTVTVDACYSGTITRGGVQLVRGTKLDRPLVTNSKGMADGPSGIFPEGASLPRSLVVISAARNNQLAVETFDSATNKNMGALTSSFIRALSAAGTETTYRDLFERLNDDITRKTGEQNPQLEGSRDNILFSGTVLPPKPYINLKVEGAQVRLLAGGLQAMTKGSRFSIYASGTGSQTGSPMAQAEIAAVDPTTSVLTITPSPDDRMLEKLRTARAFETFHNFGDARIRVLIEAAAKTVIGDGTLRELKADLLTIVDSTASDWDVRICRKACENEKLALGQEKGRPGVVTLMRNDGSIIARIPEAKELKESIRTALEGEARWRFVKALRNETDPNLRIRMRLVPVTDVEQDPITKLAARARDLAAEVEPSDGNQIVLHDGDTVMLEVMNLGLDEPYYSILDLRSNGKIAPLFPHPWIRLGINENKLEVRNDKDGKPVWQRIPCPFVIKIDKPYGNEVFKALVTRQSSDFSPLFALDEATNIQQNSPRGTARGRDEARSPLGQVLLTLTTGKIASTKRSGARDGPSQNTGLIGAPDATKMSIPIEGWATAEIAFQAGPPRNGPPR